MPFLNSAADHYHLWYYKSGVWQTTTWLGVSTLKSPADMWNYQEILYVRKPSLVIEFGTCCGGSALYFAHIMRGIGRPFRVLSVDIDHSRVPDIVKQDPDIELLTISSTDDRVRERIGQLRQQFPGPVFAILDSDHSKMHVLAEMKVLRPLLSKGDYLVVEDSNINGHPVLPSHGPGPYEAIQEYLRAFPHDYDSDVERERKFGFTFAPKGFLRRN